MSDSKWYEKRIKRKVKRLRLWNNNPRLDPEENHMTISDYVSDLIIDNGEKDAFLKLVKSIASQGFISVEPIVVWKNEENNAYYVAEGNRRVIALKLLLEPEKSPRAIKSYMRQQSSLIQKETIEKVGVCIAPSFEDCEWYINQRHTTSSMLKTWSRHQHQRWISSLYDKYDKNIDVVMEKTQLSRAELNKTLRILKIRDWALLDKVFNELNTTEQEGIKSHRLPMTILERWFDNTLLKERWGIVFDEGEVKITSNIDSFYKAYAKWIQLVLHRDDPDVEVQINTRTITSHFEDIYAVLPEVVSGDASSNEGLHDSQGNNGDESGDGMESEPEEAPSPEIPPTPPRPIIYKGNVNRPNLVPPCYDIATSNIKLYGLFKELKLLPHSKYKNCIAASMRIFLDLAVHEYIEAINCKDEIVRLNNRQDFYEITLKKRLNYLKDNSLRSKRDACKVLNKLINHTNEFSLDTLNNYIHGKDVHHTRKQFLNGFWDFLMPLFEEILDITEH